MTREQILSEYTISDAGTIQTLGQFQGEMLYVPYFWDAYLNGMADQDDGETLTFDVSDEDRVMFPELAGTKSRQGSAGGKVRSEAKAEAARKNGSKGGRPKDKVKETK